MLRARKHAKMRKPQARTTEMMQTVQLEKPSSVRDTGGNLDTGNTYQVYLSYSSSTVIFLSDVLVNHYSMNNIILGKLFNLSNSDSTEVFDLALHCTQVLFFLVDISFPLRKKLLPT